MFSSALKSFSSNISSNYTIASQPSSTSGPWKIFDAKKKGKGTQVSVFVFDKKSLEPSGASLGGRSGASSLKRTHEEVLERLKKEANSLARLRHPSILELAEPVEETRNGGLMFATEPVTASLAGLLAERDERGSGRASRFVVEEADGQGNKKRELELDELEIQKGLLQVGKGLEFLHQSAGLVHANLTPEAIFVNAKSDWKISGLAFAGAPTDSTSSAAPISLSEILNHDPRLPQSVQLNLDYASPDFVMDQNATCSADIFSLGLLIIALYNSPHRSPLATHGSISTYKRIFASSSTVPTQQNNFLSSGTLPTDLVSDLLPRLITRRPAQRLDASAFQQAKYFDNILVSTIRFLDALPAKTPNEKAQFMRGLPRIMPQFPSSVLERKILPVLLDEMKDLELLAAILQNTFAIIKAIPSGKAAFTQKIIPKLRETFLGPNNKAANTERNASKEAGLMVVLENMSLIAQNCSGKDFRDDILPIVACGLGSQTHALIDAALSALPALLPVLDYSTIKNELFPVIANVFAHTNSLAIKIRGLEAINTLCGGNDDLDQASGDGLDGLALEQKNPKSSSSVLDKYTVQEKVVPLVKGIKTKEPGVMIAALKVLRQVGKVADTDFLALEVLPILWTFALGPLLNLEQFQAFMSLIKSLSARVEQEQTRKLQDLGSNNGVTSSQGSRQAIRGVASVATGADSGGGEVDFESLVTGRSLKNGTPDIMDDWAAPARRPSNSRTISTQQNGQTPPNYAWSSSSPARASNAASLQPAANHTPTTLAQAASMRTVTPDQSLHGPFAALTPASPYSQPLKPSNLNSSMASLNNATASPTSLATGTAINWSAAANNAASSTWAAQRPTGNALSSPPAPPLNMAMSFALPPPPIAPVSSSTRPNFPATTNILPRQTSAANTTQGTANVQTQGLDKYQSLL